MSTDDGLRAEFRRHLPRPDWQWTAVETGGSAAGVPDSYWGHGPTRTSGWLEMKRTDGWAVAFRPLQVAWHARYGPCGARRLAAVRARGVGSGGWQGDSLWLVAGAGVPLLADGGLRAAWVAGVVLGHWYGPPPSWDWAAVARLLTGHSEQA